MGERAWSWVMLLGGVVACEPRSSPPAAPALPSASAPVLASSAPVVAEGPVDAGAPLPVATTPAAPVVASLCELLDRASAGAPATEPDGITRVMAIATIGTGWGDFEGGSEDTILYPSGFYRFSRNAPLSGASSKKNGYYTVTDRAALQETFDAMAASTAIERVVPRFIEPPALSRPGPTLRTTVTVGAEHVTVPDSPRDLASRFVGTAEPAGLLRPGVVGHHVADLKVLHAVSDQAIDCIATFDHRQAALFAALIGKARATPRSFLDDAIAQLDPSFADVKAKLSKLSAAAPATAPQPPASQPMIPSPPSSVPPPGDVKLGGATSAPPVADAERVVAGLRPRLRACYRNAAPEDMKHAGKVHLRATIAPNGEVSSATVVENGGFSARLESCMKRVVTNAIFAPPGGGGATVDIPLTLVPPSVPPVP